MISGTDLQTFTGNLLSSGAGVLLTVTRPAATQGGTPTTRTVYFSPQAQKDSGSPLMVEGGGNVGDANDYDFVCAGGSDVAERDIIGPYDGANWRVENTNENPLGTTAPVKHVFAVRQGLV